MIGHHHIGKNGRVGHQMFQYAATRGIAAAKGYKFAIPDGPQSDAEFEDEENPVRIRLKGDWTDHLIGEKWSFRVETKKNKYIKIRDEIEKILFSYAVQEKDLWAVSLAAGRFASMNLNKIDGTDKTIEFFKNCIETQKKSLN